MLRHNWLGVCGTIATVVFFACNDSTGPSEPSSIVVTPDTATVVSLGATVQLAATALDADGNTIIGAMKTWASSDLAIATVSNAGMVTAIANGTATVTAASGGVTSNGAAITVQQEVASVELSGDSAAIIVGDTLVLAAMAKDANDSLVVSVSVTWSTSDMTVATVDTQGLVRAVGDGTATITAAAESVTGVMTLAVADSVASYIVTFDATWSAATQPVSFPGNPHFSRLIGGTHNADLVVWELASLASTGMKDMAELGSTSPLDSEIEAAIQAGTAWRLLQGGNIGLSPGSANPLAFEIHADLPLVTLVSMVAPSPDWFVGVSAMSLFEGGTWIDRIVIELVAYDAGTDSGVSYTSANLATAPPATISKLVTSPFDTNQVMGTFTFERQQ